MILRNMIKCFSKAAWGLSWSESNAVATDGTVNTWGALNYFLPTYSNGDVPSQTVLYNVLSKFEKFWNGSTLNDSSSVNYSTYMLLLVGTGTTPPTVDDYKLEAPLFNDDITLLAVSNPCGIMNGTITATHQNQGDTNITINELGAGVIIGLGNTNSTASVTSSSSNAPLYGGCFQLTRSVLTVPVILEPGATRTFSVTIDLTNLATEVVNT